MAEFYGSRSLGQRTQLINALRAHLAEHGVIAPQGVASLASLVKVLEENDIGLNLIVVEAARLYLEQIAVLSSRISSLEKALKSEAKQSERMARLMSMPGMGPITAMAIEAFAPAMATFRKGRDFAAWLGLVPKQHSSGGKPVLGRTSKMSQRDIRRLLIVGAMTVIRWACRKGAPEGSWLQRMLMRKPRMLVAIALANKMARSIWAMMTKNENYRNPSLAAV
ncbi:MAG: IS110 family transposase [Beijerinckiaceae bacterium]|nr:MAG: IS110 family transposase [Beijerinckiaceae bacterium]